MIRFCTGYIFLPNNSSFLGLWAAEPFYHLKKFIVKSNQQIGLLFRKLATLAQKSLSEFPVVFIKGKGMK